MHQKAGLTWGSCGLVSPKTGDIGVELEIEGLNLPRELSGWIVKFEQSLRGANGRSVQSGENLVDTPQEYVLYRPATLKLLETKLRALHHALTLAPTVVNLTPRASTHFHVNMSHETIRSIIGYIIIFCIIEPVLLRICGPLRNGNHFCLPSYESGDLPGLVEKMCQAAMLQVNKYWPMNRGKYAALNLDPLATFGSVELRCFPNSIDPQDILRWAEWVLNIRSLARNWDDDTYMKLLDTAYEDPNWILGTIFGDYSLFQPCAPQTPQELVHFGIEQAYEVARAATPLLGDQKKVKPVFDPKMKITLTTDDLWEPPLDDLPDTMFIEDDLD